MMYCAVNLETHKTYVGTLDEVLTNVFMWRIGEQRKLFITADGYDEVESFSYSKAWGYEEISKDVRATLARLLRNGSYPNWKLFKEMQ
jgi:hypothetical protein